VAAQDQEKTTPSVEETNGLDEATYTGETNEEAATGAGADQVNLEGSDSEEQIAALREQVEESNNRLLRLQADYDNFRRRTRQEKEDFAKYASQRLIEMLVPVIDNFERALQAAQVNNDFDSFVKGVDMIFRQFDQVLSSEGLQRMETVGQPFNPEFHQAVMQVESEEHEEGTIVEEMQKGYILKDKVIRPAMVKVSS
jgi:molecular chaperone GrpE